MGVKVGVMIATAILLSAYFTGSICDSKSSSDNDLEYMARGRRYDQHVGVNRVRETIKTAKPNVIGLIETYGSGPVIADSLSYYFYLISSNLSILSRIPT